MAFLPWRLFKGTILAINVEKMRMGARNFGVPCIEELVPSAAVVPADAAASAAALLPTKRFLGCFVAADGATGVCSVPTSTLDVGWCCSAWACIICASSMSAAMPRST